MASPNSFTDRLSEISGEIASANAYMALALQPDVALSGLALRGIQQCVGKLLLSLPLISSWGLEDSNTSRMVVNAMTSFVNELAGIFVDIFVPVDFETDPDSLLGSVDNYMKAVLSSLTNPLAAVIATQQNLLTSSLTQIKQILYSEGKGDESRGFINQYSAEIERIFKTLFVKDADLGIAGIVMFAFEEAIPSIESELIYLRGIKKIARKGLEDIANLPKSLDKNAVGLMNASTVKKLGDAEGELRKVEATLQRDNVFDRKAFGLATKHVCDATHQIFDGKVDADFLKFHAGNYTGLSQAQMNQLANTRILPNLEFRVNLVKLNSYANAFEQADRNTRVLHANIIKAAETLDRLAETRLGDIMALLVALLRRQIAGARADLEAQSQGYSGYNDAKTEVDERKRYAERVDATSSDMTNAERQEARARGPSASTVQPYTSAFDKKVTPGEKGAAFGKPQVDIYAYMAAQAGAYVVLAAACKIMQATSGIYRGLDQVLKGESKVVKFIKDFIGDVKNKCPNPEGGLTVLKASSAYAIALEDRLNGKTNSNTAVIQAAKQLVGAVEDYEKFLNCFKVMIFFGNEALAAIVSTAAAAISAAKTALALVRQIRMMVRLYPQLKEMYKNLDLLKILGLDGLTYNALDTVVAALQCLVLQCDNPYVTDLASRAAQQFAGDLGKKRAGAITMGSLDEIPKAGMLGIIMKKVQAVLRLVELVNSLTSLDLRVLCNVKTQTTSNGPSPAAALSKLTAAAPDLVVDIAPWRDAARAAEQATGVKAQADGTLR